MHRSSPSVGIGIALVLGLFQRYRATTRARTTADRRRNISFFIGLSGCGWAQPSADKPPDEPDTRDRNATQEQDGGHCNDKVK